MNIENILNLISEQNPSRIGFYFDLIIKNIIKSHLQKQGKKFESEYIINHIRLDGYSENGIDQYQGPTAFEIKLNSLSANDTFKALLKILEETHVNQVILICPKNSIKLLKILNENSSKIILWSIEKINELIDKNLEIFENTFDNLFKLDVENEISKKSKHWKDIRVDILNNVKRVYEEGKFSLLLGAGVSCSAGFPDWKKLLNSLYANYVNKVFNDKSISEDTLKAITQKFIDINNDSTLATARYLKAALSQKNNDTSFIASVKKALYNSPISSSCLVDSIINLCIPKRNGTKIKSIVTYNFDNLIEESLEKFKLEYKTICKDEDQHNENELPVYHVHGYIPNKDKINEDAYLIFSEESYHKVYSEPYHWSNLVQLATLRENNCLMIGLSLNDPNLRRLLEIAAQKHSGHNRHYVFMKRMDINSILEQNNDNILDIDSAKKILKIHHVIQEMMLSGLGTNIIWIENYEEIPSLLDFIRK